MTFTLLTPLAPGETRATLASHLAEGGYAALRRAALGELLPAQIRTLVAAAALRGRGGAAFPTARKWELAAASAGPHKHVVANGGEHEPGSLKDKLLVARHPHKVLEGMALCGIATGATKGWLYLIRDMADALASARAAIDEARAAGWLGSAIAGSTLAFDVEVVTAPTTYVAGEETAALEVIEGRKAWPRKKPPYPGQAGVRGEPTTVNNVETLAVVPAIARGVPGAGTTMLFTLPEAVRHPGVHELPQGATFRQLVDGAGGGTRSGRALRAILPALSSAFLRAPAHLDTPMTHEAVTAAGSGLGCGGVTLVEEGQCLVERTLEIAQFFMREQCGQCPPCRMETNTLASVLKQVQAGQAGDYRAQVDKITGFARGKGHCSLIEMAAAPVVSALALFPEDFARHAAGQGCPTAP